MLFRSLGILSVAEQEQAMAVGMAASFVANAADVPLVPTHVAPRVAVEREEA